MHTDGWYLASQRASAWPLTSPGVSTSESTTSTRAVHENTAIASPAQTASMTRKPASRRNSAVRHRTRNSASTTNTVGGCCCGSEVTTATDSILASSNSIRALGPALEHGSETRFHILRMVGL